MLIDLYMFWYFTGALVILALAVLTPLFYYIPNAALAGVIIMAVLDMADFSLIKKLWQVKSKWDWLSVFEMRFPIKWKAIKVTF